MKSLMASLITAEAFFRDVFMISRMVAISSSLTRKDITSPTGFFFLLPMVNSFITAVNKHVPC